MPAYRFDRLVPSVASVGLAMFVGLSFSAPALISQAQTSKQQTQEQPTSKQQPTLQQQQPTPEQIKRFTQLEVLLTGATLAGHSTTTGGDSTKLEPDHYELQSVKHLGNNRWLFRARIRYGENDVTVPITLPVHWAGDTPVITVDNMGIPGLGTYTARVMIYADHYAGFWSGGDHGGHLFGVIKRQQPE